jgi:hypothetical protein
MASEKETGREIHTWRQRRSRCDELQQWDTSEHAWLEKRGAKLYLISMIDDASRLWVRFVEHDSTEENMKLLWSYLEQYGRPLSVYTDKATLFANLPKTRRGEVAGKDREELPPAQIGRALQELGIEGIAAHSPQAKGRVERGFGTMQDRLVKGLRVAGAKTLEQANTYLREEFLPWWNQTLTSQPTSSDDAHRALGKEHSLAASLSYVDSRQVASDYTIRFDNRVVSNSTGGCASRFTRRHRARLSALGCFIGCSFSRSLSCHRRVSGAAQSCGTLPTQTSVNQAFKTKPSAGTVPCSLCRGLVAVYFGANPVAPALCLPLERDLPRNYFYSNRNFSFCLSKPDISTWQRIGHFYLALTGKIFIFIL